MAELSVSAAAKMVGKDKSTLYRLMDFGKLSYSVDDAGHRVIDSSELLRVFPNATANATENKTENDALQSVLILLQEQLRAAAERETWMKAKVDSLEKRCIDLEQRLLPPGDQDSAKEIFPVANPVACETDATEKGKGFWARLFGFGRDRKKEAAQAAEIAALKAKIAEMEQHR